MKAEAVGTFDARSFRMQTAPDGRPVFRPVGTAGAGDEQWQDGFGLLNGADSQVRSVVQSGNSIYVGGNFTSVDRIMASYVARWDGSAWSSLGTGTANGVNAAVNVLAVASNGDLYAGGNFTQAGGLAASRVARWNGTAWSSLGTGSANGMSGGINTSVNALAVASNGDLYAGGSFAQAGGIAANNVARWNGTAWSSLGTGPANGVSGVVNALVSTSSGDLYVGGYFIRAGGTAVNRLARWNGTAWSDMNTGVASGSNEYVSALAVGANGEVYVGGRFTQFGGIAANNVARWNGTTWSSLGTGPASGMSGTVLVLGFASNGDLYAGGAFDQAGGAAANNVARWNGTAWSSLGTGPANGVSRAVYALAFASGGDVYVGGAFGQAGGLAANRVVRWNGTDWNSLGNNPGAANGVSGPVDALVVANNGDVYAAGNFNVAGGTVANGVARWNGTAWSSLGQGPANGVRGIVSALALAQNGDLYAGGAFGQAGGAAANNVARWNGTAWSSLGTGPANGTDDEVLALATTSNGDLYVGGYFTQAGGVLSNHIARWNGTAWSSLGTGPANGVEDAVLALSVAGNGDLYVGGYFTQAGGVLSNHIARWNGTAWSSLGTGPANGTEEAVLALAMTSNGDLYVGGYFIQAGGAITNQVARWNGTAWSGLGTGVNRTVKTLSSGLTGKLVVGGDFTTTGDGSKLMACFGIYDVSVLLAVKAQAGPGPAAIFPNPASGTATLSLPPSAPRMPLILIDALGRTVRRYHVPTSLDILLDLHGLPAGAYLVRCGQFTQRLVVK
ncbi:hypothetical protein [Hymenobacter sp.]|uniref:hypothetical protein n=1 Tax=Hymenobacter sp. TaxID=1898978 RepID=UPI00286C86A1|nr:hypothetical protein [Hymenobacter sp.]